MRPLITFAILLVSCTSKVPEERLNSEAISLHNSMIKKAARIGDRLNELTGDTLVNQDSVKLLLGLLKRWRSELVEVPGNEDHHHDHAHSHAHTSSDVTPGQMLEIQKELDIRLSIIGKRTTQLKPQDDIEHEH